MMPRATAPPRARCQLRGRRLRGGCGGIGAPGPMGTGPVGKVPGNPPGKVPGRGALPCAGIPGIGIPGKGPGAGAFCAGAPGAGWPESGYMRGSSGSREICYTITKMQLERAAPVCRRNRVSRTPPRWCAGSCPATRETLTSCSPCQPGCSPLCGRCLGWRLPFCLCRCVWLVSVCLAGCGRCADGAADLPSRGKAVAAALVGSPRPRRSRVRRVPPLPGS
jgi:hypothetical protein